MRYISFRVQKGSYLQELFDYCLSQDFVQVKLMKENERYENAASTFNTNKKIRGE
jgi:hypothetical protein